MDDDGDVRVKRGRCAGGSNHLGEDAWGTVAFEMKEKKEERVTKN